MNRIQPNSPIQTTSPSHASASLLGVLNVVDGPEGGYFVSNSEGRTEIIAAGSIKDELRRLVSSRAALVMVEGETTQYHDPRTGGQRPVIEATRVFRAGMGSADLTTQLVNGESMTFLQGSAGRMPLFGATAAATATLDQFQALGPGSTQLARLVGKIEGGAFQASSVELLLPSRRDSSPELSQHRLFPSRAVENSGLPAVGRPSRKPV